MPETEVEDVLHLVVGHVAGGLDLREDARLAPIVPRCSMRVAVRREHPREVGGEPAAGDVRERVDVDVARAPRACAGA